MEKNNIERFCDTKDSTKTEDTDKENNVKTLEINASNLRKKVTREEVIEIIKQVVDNVNQIADYLMKDVNTMYAQHVFPFQIRQAVIEDILVEKGITTKDEIDKMAEERVNKLKEQAKEIKENNQKEDEDESKSNG